MPTHAAFEAKHGFVPKALLIKSLDAQEENEWRDKSYYQIGQELGAKNIQVTTDPTEINNVLMTIVFLNAAFLRNNQQFLQLCIDNVITRFMMLIPIVYEDDDDSKLVTEIFQKFDGDYPTDFYFDIYPPEALTKLVLAFFNRFQTMFWKTPNSNMNKNIHRRGTLESFINHLVNLINPLYLDFSKIESNLMCQVAAMSYDIEMGRKRLFGHYNPLLVLFKYQPCLEHGCTSQTMTSILQLLYTHQNFFGRWDFADHCIYVSIEKGEPPRSLKTILESALEARYPNYDSSTYISSFLIVIEDIQKFFQEGEDPRPTLLWILKILRRGGLVITSIPNSLKPPDADCLGPVGVKCECFHFSLNTIRQPWSVCYTMIRGQLENLPVENLVKDDNYSVQKKKKKVHIMEKFDVSGNLEKKLRGGGEEISRT